MLPPCPHYPVSTHSRPKAAGQFNWVLRRLDEFQHTAARRRLARSLASICLALTVSTHSRPKAAGCLAVDVEITALSFNTQPPEGGWLYPRKRTYHITGFNTQPPEGGWLVFCRIVQICWVSTHSRPKAAGNSQKSN